MAGGFPFDISLNQPNSETVAAVWGVPCMVVFPDNMGIAWNGMQK